MTATLQVVRRSPLEADAAALWLKRLNPENHFLASDRTAVASLISGSRTLRRGATLLREGEPEVSAVLVVEGFLCRAKAAADGRRQIVAILVPGDLCDGDIGLFRGMDTSVSALSNTVVALIPVAALDRVRSSCPNIDRALRTLAGQDAAIAREWVTNLGARSARARVAHLICELVWRLREAGLVRDHRCALPITQEDIADATGLSIVHTNRVLQELRRAGLIVLETARLDVRDLDGLEEGGEFSEDYLQRRLR